MKEKKDDKELKKAIVNLYQNGKKISELSHEYNISRQTISRWIKQNEILKKLEMEKKMKYKIQKRKEMLKNLLRDLD